MLLTLPSSFSLLKTSLASTLTSRRSPHLSQKILLRLNGLTWPQAMHLSSYLFTTPHTLS